GAPSWLKWSVALVLVVICVGATRYLKQRAAAATKLPTPATPTGPDLSAISMPSPSTAPLASSDSTINANDIFRAPAEASSTPKSTANHVETTSPQSSSAANRPSASSSQSPSTQRTETSPALTALQDKFLVALAREKDKASAAGDATLAEKLTDESRRFSEEKEVPKTDPLEIHPVVARLRAIYRDERARLPAATSVNPVADAPAPPTANMTVWWQCDDRAEPLLNGQPVVATAAKVFKFEGAAATIWQAEVAFSEGDTLGFKLRNLKGARHFVAVAKAGLRLLFVSDLKWEYLDTEPPVDWWVGKDRSAQPVQRLATRDYNDPWVREFCAFTSVPSGSLTVCWGQNPVRTHLRRTLTSFDFHTALGSDAR
ncbi:MAG: hypothetical protein ACKV19_23470, partial [Verrucomicrobiales bacterium]